MASLTVRERILVQLEKNLKGMQKDFNEYHTTFKLVTREPLTRMQNLVGPACSLTDGDTVQITDAVGFLSHLMPVEVEVWIQRPSVSATNRNSASKSLNLILGDVQRLLLSDLHVVEEKTDTPLAVNVQLVSDILDLEGPVEKTCSLLLEANVTFRTNKQNPFDPKPGGQ